MLLAAEVTTSTASTTRRGSFRSVSRPLRFSALVFLLAGSFLSFQRVWGEVAIPAEALSRLDREAQITALTSVMQLRQAKEANVEFTARCSFYFALLEKDGRIPNSGLKPLNPEIVTVVHQKRLDESYFSEQLWDADKSEQPPEDVYCRNFFDADTGINKGFTEISGGNAGSGRISNQQDTAEKANRINSLFGNSGTNYYPSLYATVHGLLDAAKVRIEVVGTKVKLSLRTPPLPGSGRSRESVIELSADHGYLPVSMETKHFKADGSIMIVDLIRVEEIRTTNGYHFPARIFMVRSGEPGIPEDPAAVREYTFQSTEFGHLTKQDLEFDFPADTVVVNELERTGYVTLPNDQRRPLPTPMAFVQNSESTDTADGGPTRRMNLFIVLNVAALVAVAVYLARKSLLRKTIENGNPPSDGAVG